MRDNSIRSKVEILTNNGISINQEKLGKIIDSKFLESEISLLHKQDVLKYYIHIYKNVEIDNSNKNNSYIMWLADKVDTIDLSRGPNITKGSSSLPDIDLDVPAEHRDEVIQYIKSKYGEENVSQMVTFNSLMGRSALKEVLKVYNAASFTEMNEMTKDIPNEAEIIDDLQESGETSIIMWALKNRAKKLEKWCRIENNELVGDYADIFRKAISIEGTKKSQGKHAAGIIISAKPLKNVCPMVRDKEGVPVAGFEMGDLELLGHVKFDILGVDILSKIMKITQESNITIDDLHNFEDQDTWNLLSSGDVKGIFQLERQRRWTKALRPRSMEHLSALIAIIRPGVADVIVDGKSMTKKYIDRKNGEEDINYEFPCLEPILKNTYGIMIYQEQALRIASEIAGFDLKEADALRKAIGKKLVDKMAELKDKFINGCVAKGTLNRDKATQLFEWIEKSQKYLFNASVTKDCYVESIDGEIKSIVDVHIGEKITSPYGPTTVLNKFCHGEQDVYEIILESGKSIQCTMEHKFLCEDSIIRPLSDILLYHHRIIGETD